MKIGLYGIFGLYNFGCEAIVRGTVAVIRSVHPDAEIIYFSVRADDDRKVIEDLGIQVIQIKSYYSLLERVANRIFRELRIPLCLGEREIKPVIKASDIIFSIGGDIYTLPAVLRQKKTYAFYNRLVRMGEMAKAAGKKVIVFGASIGPFGDYQRAKKYYFDHFKKLDLIVAREENCIAYLKANGIEDHVFMLPDPAFFVQKADGNESDKKYIGINLSPLSMMELYGAIREDMYASLAAMLTQIHRKTGCDLLMLPHVVSPVSENDNDLLFQQRIIDQMDEETKKHIRLSAERGFLNIKKDIASCRLLVSARMHCAINAICEGVPTIFLSYSSKSDGMAKFIYGNDQWVIPIKEMQESLVPKICDMLASEDHLSAFLRKRVQEIRTNKSNNDVLNTLKEVLGRER